MAKTIFLFKINNNFSSLNKENNLEIILNIFLKAQSSNFYFEQFKLIIDKIDVEIIENSIINNFENRNNFIINDNLLILHNSFKNLDEKIEFLANYIKITTSENNSLFLDFLSLYFIDLVAIELEDEKIYPLYLVKTAVLV